MILAYTVLTLYLYDMTSTQHGGLAALPSHVIRNVASRLDRQSAVSLAITCSAIRPIAESVVWQELNISVHRSFLPNPMPHPHTRPLGGNRLFAIREEYIWGPASAGVNEDDVDLYGQPWSVKRYYVDLLRHLKASPIRLSSVQRIHVDVDRLLSMHIVPLLELASPTLKHFEFIPPGLSYDSLSASSRLPTTIRSIFQVLSTPLTLCQYLHLPLDTHWDLTILEVLPKTPRLRHLRLSVEQPYSGSWAESMVFPARNEPLDGWPILPYLKKLELDEMSPAFVPFLLALVAGAHHLEEVSLLDPDRSWNPFKDDELVSVLACSTSLRYLACRKPVLRGLEHGSPGFATVRELALHEDKQPWGLTQLESVTIPPLPAMQILYSYTHLKEGRSITWAWDGETRGQPSPVRPISSNTLFAISNAPNLLLIQFPDISNTERGRPLSPEEWDYWGSAKCFAAHDRGTLIRTYCNPETGEVFTHCRSYSAHYSHIDEGIIHRSEDVWEEHVDFQGEAVKAGTLASVYAMLSETAGWKVPGRGLSLPAEAWALLRSCQILDHCTIVYRLSDCHVISAYDTRCYTRYSAI